MMCSFFNFNVSLSDNGIGSEGLLVLGSALQSNNALEELNLKNCQLVGTPYRPEYKGLIALMRGIEGKRSKLLRLNVASNNLLPNGVRIVASSVGFHKMLRFIDMSNNQFSSFGNLEGIMGIVALLQYSKTIERLDVRQSFIAPKIVPILQDALEGKHALKIIDLRKCRVARQQHLQLFQNLKNTSLQVLHGD